MPRRQLVESYIRIARLLTNHISLHRIKMIPIRTGKISSVTAEDQLNAACEAMELLLVKIAEVQSRQGGVASHSPDERYLADLEKAYRHYYRYAEAVSQQLLGAFTASRRQTCEAA